MEVLKTARDSVLWLFWFSCPCEEPTAGWSLHHPAAAALAQASEPAALLPPGVGQATGRVPASSKHPANSSEAAPVSAPADWDLGA